MTSERAVLVAGMHRSGTSMVGGMLGALGVDMGERLIPADARNARGYFEDADVVEFHGRVFRALLPDGARGHVDWGWAEDAEIDARRLAGFREEARSLAAARASAGGPWGFKDPRATLALELWLAAVPAARFVLVYRLPWEVSDSMQRLGAPVFDRNPSYGYRIWAHYNARLAEFCERHRERCLLVSANALPGALPRFRGLLSGKLGLRLADTDLEQAFAAELFTGGDADDRRADLVAAAYPECTRLLARLDALAEVPGAGTWRSRAPARTALRPPDDGGPSPALSIVVPTHDDGVLLLDALASVERCAPPDCEVAIVDDGSTDAETLRILGALRDRGHHVLAKENGGLSSARNAGLEATRGRYVLPLDADNRLRPGFPEAALAELDADPTLGVVYGDRRLFGALEGVVRVPEFDLAKLRGGNYVDACAVYRRAVWEDVGGYDTAMVGLEDWEFWLHAGRRGWRFRHLERVAFDYRVRAGSLLALSLSPGVRRQLFEHVLGKHGALFHAGVPAPLRLPSLLLGRVLTPGARAALEACESRLFWRALWALIGPAGLFAADGRRRRARRKDAA